MSDEPSQPPPPLRLKPRLRAPEADASLPTPPAVAAPPAREVPAPVLFQDPENVPVVPTLRARPALTANPKPPGAALIPPSPPAPIRLTPPPAVAPLPEVVGTAPDAAAGASAPTADSAKFRLKPKVPAGPPVVAAQNPPSVPPLFAPAATVKSPGAKTPPLFPVVAPPARTGNTGFPVPHLRVPTGPDANAAPVPKPVEKKRDSKFTLIGLAAVIVLGGAFAWMQYGARLVAFVTTAKPAPAVSPPATATAPKSVAPPSPVASVANAIPTGALNALAHAPKNAIDKAQDVVTGQRAREQARIDAIADGEEPPRRAPVASGSTTSPAGSPAKSVTSVRAIAPGVSTTTEIETASGGSTEFRSFVANAKISGVAEGAAPKVFINGRLARAGETVDAALGIVFDRLEPAKRLLVFRDRTGAIATRRY